MKKIQLNKSVQQKLLEGSQLLYDCVSATLGPKGSQVMISRKWNSPYILRDGVSVASQVEHENEFVDMAIKTIRNAAQRTVIDVGDSTTSTIILAHNLIDGGMKLIESGYNKMTLRDEIIESMNKVLPEIAKYAKPVADEKSIENVAKVSSGSDELSKLVAAAIDKAGDDGRVTVEESPFEASTLEFVEGMTLDSGFLSPYFITNPRQAEAIVENPLVIVFKKRVTLAMEELAPILNILVRISPEKSFVFVGDVSNQALKLLLENKLNGNINALAVNVPGHGARRDEQLDDIATLTGAVVLDSQIGFDAQTLAEHINKFHFGVAKSVIASQRSTTFIPKLESIDKEEQKRLDQIRRNIQTKVDSLRSQVKKAEQAYDREVLQERIARFTTGVAVIKIGSKTDVDMREKVELVKDALGAVRAAQSEGIVPGAGTVYLRMAKLLEKDTSKGGQLLHHTLKQVTYKLLENAGVDDPNSLVSELYNTKGNDGYEVLTKSITDLNKAGIVDPAQATRVALQNAVSVATSVLTTGVMIADEYIKPVAFKDPGVEG